MITIDLRSPTPLHDQIVSFLRHTLATGRLAPGDPLPAVRQLAADLGINFNTVARAYRALESSGLVHTARGRGTRVLAAVETDEPSAAAGAREAIRNALADARLAGLTKEQLDMVLDEETSLLWPEPNQETTQP